MSRGKPLSEWCIENSKENLLEEFDIEKNDGLTPESISYGSGRKIWWKCSVCGFSWESTVSHRTHMGRGCPKCGKRSAAKKLEKKNLVIGVSDLETLFPEIAKEWDRELNDTNPSEWSPYSMHKAYWKCGNGHSFYSAIADRTAGGNGCPYCSGAKVLEGFNDLASIFPEIAKELDAEKNGFSAQEITSKSSKRVWWTCPKGHSYKQSISDRTRTDRKGTGCPYCSGRRPIVGETDLKTLAPEIAAQWNYEKNAKKPEEYTLRSGESVWWICDKGHEYISRIADRTSVGRGCPYCSNQKVLKGFNDLATLYLDVAAEWDYEANEKAPSDVIPGSHIIVGWKCHVCGNRWNAQVKERAYGGTGCPKCAFVHKTSFQEQAVYYYVSKLFPNAINSYRPSFLEGMEVDVFVPDVSVGIEYDGKQWHQKTARDVRKGSLMSQHNLKLIRIREKGLPAVDDGSLQILLSDNSDEELNKAIRNVLLEIALDREPEIDIDITRDCNEILDSYRTIIKGKSLAEENEKLLSEWNWERNAPLTPQEVSAHSHLVVWWRCSFCGKEWQQSIHTKNKANSRMGCRSCIHSQNNRKRYGLEH